MDRRWPAARLTTLYTTLLRIANEAEKGGAKELSQSIYRQYLFNQDGANKDHPKLLPTLLDHCQFNSLFGAGSFSMLNIRDS